MPSYVHTSNGPYGPARSINKTNIITQFQSEVLKKIRYVICAGWQFNKEQIIDTFSNTVQPCVLYVGGVTKVKKKRSSCPCSRYKGIQEV